MRFLLLSLTCAITLAIAGQPALARDASGGAVMTKIPKNKISSNDSNSDWSEDEKAQMRERYAANCGPNGADPKMPICRQDESFRMAGNASTYLGYYFMQYSAFGSLNPNVEKNREALKNAMQRCLVENNGACDENDKKNLMAGLVQHNLGKEMRKMTLTNNTNYENMKSLEDPKYENQTAYDPTFKRGEPKERPVYKVDPSELADGVTIRVNSKLENEKAILGKEFLSEYNTFLDAYTKTTSDNEDWHYVAAVPNGADLSQNTTIAGGKGAAYGTFYDDEHRVDVLSQTNQRTTDIVKEFREGIKEPSIIVNTNEGPKIDADQFNKETKMGDLYLEPQVQAEREDGEIVTGAQATPAIVQGINKTIDEQIAEKRKSTNAGNPDGSQTVVNSYSVNDEAFRKFLDGIWPTSVARNTSSAPVDRK